MHGRLKDVSTFRVTRSSHGQLLEALCNRTVNEPIIVIGEREYVDLDVYAFKGIKTGAIYETNCDESEISQVSTDSTEYFFGNIQPREGITF